MRRRAAHVKLSTATTYKVRNLGDIGDAKCANAGLLSLKCEVCFTLDFGIASTNECVPHLQNKRLSVAKGDTLRRLFVGAYETKGCAQRQTTASDRGMRKLSLENVKVVGIGDR